MGMNLPFDRLNKFLAIGCLISSLYIAFTLVSQFDQLTIEMIEETAKADLVGNELEYLKKDVIATKNSIISTSTSDAVKIYEGKVFNLANATIVLDKNRQIIKYKTDRFYVNAFLGFIILICLMFISLFNFFKWYKYDKQYPQSKDS